MATQSRALVDRPTWALAYAWSGIVLMWAFWICFAVFLSSPRRLLEHWPLPTVDEGGLGGSAWLAAFVDIALIAQFGLQHSLMARPWFKQCVLHRLPVAFERCTYVHMANVSLFTLIIAWQPIPIEIWNVGRGVWQHALLVASGTGWLILFLGAWSFGIFELLGLKQMRDWIDGRATYEPKFKTGGAYKWLQNPMYVGVLLAVWASPSMTAGHLLLAVGFTTYVLIAMRYERRDLHARYGESYARWRSQGSIT